MKILITGARGFIGSHLGNTLINKGHTVLGVDNESNPSKNQTNFEIKKINARDIDIEGIDVILHLAGYINVDESIEKPELYYENNTMETLHILEKLRKNPKCKFIYASSAEVYGTALNNPMNELHPLNPLSPYAFSKFSAEGMCKFYTDFYNLDITIIRNFNTFGPYQRDDKYGGVISKFITQGKNKKSLTVYGDGEQMRDYMHVSQAVSGYILAIEKRLPLYINFGSGNPVKIIDIANHIAKKYGVGIDFLPPRKNEIKLLHADITKALSFGYKIQTDFWKNLDELL